ncbi:hypothetical protein ACFL2R_01185 [Patescibacteria group bacterium]
MKKIMLIFAICLMFAPASFAAESTEKSLKDIDVSAEDTGVEGLADSRGMNDMTESQDLLAHAGWGPHAHAYQCVTPYGNCWLRYPMHPGESCYCDFGAYGFAR